MAPAPGCPEWEYTNHPQSATAVPARALELKATLSVDPVAAAAAAVDTRDAHYKMFSQVTPIGFPYYAGHYRGEDFPCLKLCSVGINGDPRVGEQPHRVGLRMFRFSSFIKKTIIALDAEAPISTTRELQRLILFISRSFVDFLTIHPYVNGNGHAARMILCAIMLHYGFQPKWPIDERPAEPYTVLITEYRNGNPLPLEAHILQWLI
jgi:fido (protein-threonine AMPylation protein)